MKYIGIAIMIMGAVMVFYQTAFATNKSTITQSIEPITCVYTATQTGAASSSDTTCDDRNVPIVSLAKYQMHSVYISGYFDPVTAKSLRLKFAGIWYVLGQSRELTRSGSKWQFHIVVSPKDLPEGKYDVMIEATTNTGFVLKSIYESILTVSYLQRIETITSVDNKGSQSVASVMIDHSRESAIIERDQDDQGLVQDSDHVSEDDANKPAKEVSSDYRNTAVMIVISAMTVVLGAAILVRAKFR